MSPEDVKFQTSKSLDGCLKYLFRKKNIGKENNTARHLYVCISMNQGPV
jgi:hypothetical protein